MDKIYKCDYCGSTSSITNSRGGCVSCGAPMKRENIEILNDNFHLPYTSYSEMRTSASTMDYSYISSASFTCNFGVGRW